MTNSEVTVTINELTGEKRMDEMLLEWGKDDPFVQQVVQEKYDREEK